MKHFVLFSVMTIAAGPALAHPGHIADVAGHGHWLGAAAIGAAIALGAWATLKGKKEETEVEAEEVEADLEETSA